MSKMNIEKEIKNLTEEILSRDCYGCEENRTTGLYSNHICGMIFFYDLAYAEAFDTIKSKYKESPEAEEEFKRLEFCSQLEKCSIKQNMNIVKETKELAYEILFKNCYGCRFSKEHKIHHSCWDHYAYRHVLIEALDIIYTKNRHSIETKEFYKRLFPCSYFEDRSRFA